MYTKVGNRYKGSFGPKELTKKEKKIYSDLAKYNKETMQLEKEMNEELATAKSPSEFMRIAGRQWKNTMMRVFGIQSPSKIGMYGKDGYNR